MLAGTALYGPLRGPRGRVPDWPCPDGHGVRRTCPRCEALARRQGQAVLVDITDATQRLATDAGMRGWLWLGRLAAEALAAGLDVGLTGAHMWVCLTEYDTAHLRGTPCGALTQDANAWHLTDRHIAGNVITGGVVIQRGQ